MLARHSQKLEWAKTGNVKNQYQSREHEIGIITIHKKDAGYL